MHYRNRRKIILGATTIAAAALSGCATPKHTNLLIFGTNTQMGVKVGVDSTQIPTIQVGYNRQELVMMPLLANSGGSGSNLQPCPAEKGTPPQTPPQLSVNCKFIGSTGSSAALQDQDSYSVLASFGTKYDVSTGTTTKVGGGIAQYFATGLAARELAKHGSALVAASESATAEATASNPAVSNLIKKRISKFSQLADLLNAATIADDSALAEAMKKIDQSAGTDKIFQDLCAAPVTKRQCVQKIRDHDSSDIFSLTEKELDGALAAKL